MFPSIFRPAAMRTVYCAARASCYYSPGVSIPSLSTRNSVSLARRYRPIKSTTPALICRGCDMK